MHFTETFAQLRPRYPELSGQAALVTGAGRGIGLAIAARLAREGMRVMLSDRRPADLAGALAGFDGLDVQVCGQAADLSQPGQAERLVQAVLEAFGQIDLLVNNAADLRRMNIGEVDEDLYDYQMAVNLKAPFFLTKLATQAMLAAGRGGSILFISSVGGLRAHWPGLPYDISKSALDSLARVTALDLARHGIRVNAIAPGATVHSLEEQADPQNETFAQVIPLGRMALGWEMAGVAAFLASSEAAYITGQTLYVDGGLTAQLHPPHQPV